MSRRKEKDGNLSVFKGREARLNKAIFHILALKGPQTVYGMHKGIRSQRGLKPTRYASVNKRVRSLEELGYLKKIGIKKTRAGFEASLYELNAKAYLSLLLNFIDIDKLLLEVNEVAAQTILASLLHSRQPFICEK